MPPPDVGDLERAWARVDQQLEPVNREALRVTTADLLQTAETLELERLTPAALALVVRSRSSSHEDALFLLREAVKLDPESPEAWFALSAEALRTGSPVAAVGASLRGAASLPGDRRHTRAVGSSLLLSAVLAALAAFVVWGLFTLRRTIPPLWHDLTELGERLRLGSNTIAVALVLLLFPAFLAGGPVWLFLWVVALCWGYLGWRGKTVGMLGLAAVVAAPFLVELGVRGLTQPTNPVFEATDALAERRWAPRVVDDLSHLQDVLGDMPGYHRLLGDCYRQFGRLDAAAWSYREGLRIDPEDGKLALAIGTVHFLEGDFNAALEAFQRARDSGVDPVIVNYDLSLTLAHTYHFRESDEAMEAARAAGERRLRELTANRDQEPILPVFSQAEARALLQRADPVLLLNRGVLPAPMTREATIAHPLAVAGAFAVFIALLHFLIRDRFGGFASACSKCGRSFCSRCKFSDESQSYCSQCINIFLKKDTVGIDGQTAKRRQVSRHSRVRRAERRLADLVLPGLGIGSTGRPWLGLVLAAVAVPAAALGFLWLPQYIRPELLETSLWLPTSVCIVAWAAALVAAQAVRGERS